jgi:hypothetical protein
VPWAYSAEVWETASQLHPESHRVTQQVQRFKNGTDAMFSPGLYPGLDSQVQEKVKRINTPMPCGPKAHSWLSVKERIHGNKSKGPEAVQLSRLCSDRQTYRRGHSGTTKTAVNTVGCRCMLILRLHETACAVENAGEET